MWDASGGAAAILRATLIPAVVVPVCLTGTFAEATRQRFATAALAGFAVFGVRATTAAPAPADARIDTAPTGASAELLDKDFGVTADIWSCPSFNELARDAVDCERFNRFNPEAKTPRKPYITELLEGRQGPAIAATDPEALLQVVVEPAVGLTR